MTNRLFIFGPMLKNWYIATFVILLTVVGVGFVPFSAPNQEIVVHFNDTVSQEDAAFAITQVKTKLLNLGAKDVQIKKGSDGALKITYYSDVAASSIKEILAAQYGLLKHTTSNNTELPFNKAIDYLDITVSEIGVGSNESKGLTGEVIQVESKSSRFYPPNLVSSAATKTPVAALFATNFSKIIKREASVKTEVAVRLLPETRAGPTA